MKTDTPLHVYWRVPHAAPIQVRDGRFRLRVSKDGLDVGTSYIADIDALSDELRAIDAVAFDVFSKAGESKHTVSHGNVSVAPVAAAGQTDVKELVFKKDGMDGDGDLVVVPTEDAVADLGLAWTPWTRFGTRVATEVEAQMRATRPAHMAGAHAMTQLLAGDLGKYLGRSP